MLFRSHSGIFAILAGRTLRELFFRSLSGILADGADFWQGWGMSCWHSDIEVWRTKAEVRLLVWGTGS